MHGKDRRLCCQTPRIICYWLRTSGNHFKEPHHCIVLSKRLPCNFLRVPYVISVKHGYAIAEDVSPLMLVLVLSLMLLVLSVREVCGITGEGSLSVPTVTTTSVRTTSLNIRPAVRG